MNYYVALSLLYAANLSVEFHDFAAEIARLLLEAAHTIALLPILLLKGRQ